MKSTGIIRNVDDLGRIVIPKELRTSLAMTEGSPAEAAALIDSGKYELITLYKHLYG